MRVCADDNLTWKCVVLQIDLVDYPCTRLPEADAISHCSRPEEAVDLTVFGERFAEVLHAFFTCLDQVVAVNRGWDGDLVSERLHELQHCRLTKHVLKYNPVRPDAYVGLARHDLLVFGIVQVRQEHLFGEAHRPVQSLANDSQPFRHSLVSLRGKFGCRLNSHHDRFLLYEERLAARTLLLC